MNKQIKRLTDEDFSIPIVMKQKGRLKERLGQKNVCCDWFAGAAAKQQGSMLHRMWAATVDPPLYHDKWELVTKSWNHLVCIYAERERETPSKKNRDYNLEVRKSRLPKK